MKLFAPKYYKDFKCIADKCEHNCCTGWEIDVDSKTLKKYKALKGGYAEVIKGSISKGRAAHFVTCDGGRCPHLDENGLCRIITNYGEDYLCDICKNHPRFFNYTDICEVGIGMSCPEAARVILSSPDYARFDEIGEVDTDCEALDFNGRIERDFVYEILTNPNNTYPEKIKTLYTKYAISEKEDGYWHELIGELEYLDENHKKLFMAYLSAYRPSEKEPYAERFLAYLIYRHCTEALDIEDASGFLPHLSTRKAQNH